MIGIEVLDLREIEVTSLILLMTSMYLILGWLVIWRGAVKWTPWRRGAIVISVLACLLLASMLGGVVQLVMDEESVTMFVIGAAWALLWLASTAIIWRETKAERIARLKMLGINVVVCPNCSYNLTGMTSTTCPECGSKYTLDQLYATLAKTDEQIDQV
ncbi:MAG TPA: hypothetical protein DCM28_19230 [Phycisphaerales bacterium]|nr:hypothetical protein [Phycisphaerales bacterium]HCD34912.1 hypothetical protein [Phycisphaerales bacterium]